MEYNLFLKKYIKYPDAFRLLVGNEHMILRARFAFTLLIFLKRKIQMFQRSGLNILIKIVYALNQVTINRSQSRSSLSYYK
jgi:hypothetical protein